MIRPSERIDEFGIKNAHREFTLRYTIASRQWRLSHPDIPTRYVPTGPRGVPSPRKQKVLAGGRDPDLYGHKRDHLPDNRENLSWHIRQGPSLARESEQA